MPIIDYERAAKQAEDKVFSNPKISDRNKKALKRYLEQYNVRPATKNKFFQHITFLLEALPDIEKQMHNRDLVNKTFNQFRKKLGQGYMSTIINVSKALTRWLNDGEKPHGFKDVKSISRKEQMRDLDETDMWNLDDAEQFAKFAPSDQFRAMIFVQLDGGFRPSEFIDLDYGDVIDKGDAIIFRVRKGKTGSRDVICDRCVSYFRKWYHYHPTKKVNDPLWVMEHLNKSHGNTVLEGIQRYEYFALQKRIAAICERAGIKKPSDFYTLRHSSCYLDKIQRVPIEFAAKKHGHSVAHFTNTYGRLGRDDLVKILRDHRKEKALAQNLLCENCGFVNLVGVEVCTQCKTPLTIKKALASSKSEVDNLRSEVEKMSDEFDRFKLTLVKGQVLVDTKGPNRSIAWGDESPAWKEHVRRTGGKHAKELSKLRKRV